MNVYFVSYGRGMCPFVKNELNFLIDRKNKNNSGESFQIRFNDEIEGKLYFETNVSLETLHSNLKTAERLFFCIVFNNLKQITDPIDEDYILKQVDEKLKFDFKKDDFLRQFAQRANDEAKKLRSSLKYRLDLKMTGAWRSNLKLKSRLLKHLEQKMASMDSSLEIDLKNPHFSLTCHLTDVSFIMGIPVSKTNLSNRGYIKYIGLRSTVCATMLQLSGLLKQNEHLTVLDPFCGKSTILAEYLGYDQSTRPFFICSDSNLQQLNDSRDNLSAWSFGGDLLASNLLECSVWPYKSHMFDLIITDLPFGKNHQIEFFHNSDDTMYRRFFEKLFVEFDRLLVIGNGTAILLINETQKTLFKQTLVDDKVPKKLKLASEHLINLGKTSGFIVKLTNFD